MLSEFPLCSSFVPTFVEGQLCYEIKLSEFSGQGKGKGLMLLLDYNENRAIGNNSKKDPQMR